jgi:sirohydrochlorin cobaltochelatase
VPPDDFSDAALIVLGHGSTQNLDSGASVFQHAEQLRSRKIFAEVREAFWKQEPLVTRRLAETAAPRVFIVPLFVSEGYFSQEVIPRALGFQLTEDPRSRFRREGSQRLHYCQPVGTHESMTEVLLGRARQVVAQFPFPRLPLPKNTTLFIAGHGTTQNTHSRQSIERQADLIGARAEYAQVRPAFLEEPPLIRDIYQVSLTRSVVVVPFFISEGLHTQEDIPVLLGQSEKLVRERLAAGQPTWRNPTEHEGKLVWYARSAGTEPRLAEVILEQVKASQAWDH